MTQDEMWLLKEKYQGKKTEGFFADSVRLKNGEPLAYLIGHIPFLGTTIYLDSHPLIPRTETEYWVEKILSDIHTTEKQLKILDLCAGSGCIGVAILKALSSATVDFVEIDESHHATIQKNIALNEIAPERARIIGGSLFEHVDGVYNYIFSNPPYVDQNLNRVSESVQKFEPALALYGGQDGIEIIKEIISQSSAHLTSQGVLYFEHEPEQITTIQTSASKSGFISTTFEDQFGHNRYTRLTRTDRKPMPQ